MKFSRKSGFITLLQWCSPISMLRIHADTHRWYYRLECSRISFFSSYGLCFFPMHKWCEKLPKNLRFKCTIEIHWKCIRNLEKPWKRTFLLNLSSTSYLAIALGIAQTYCDTDSKHFAQYNAIPRLTYFIGHSVCPKSREKNSRKLKFWNTLVQIFYRGPKGVIIKQP